MTDNPAIIWFRQDLRLKDNPALLAACEYGRPIIPIYILDDINSGEHSMGAASRWWLHHSLNDLDLSLSGNLLLFDGNPKDIILNLIQQSNADSIYWNRCYEPWRIKRDTEIKSELKAKAIQVKSLNGSLLYEPQNTNKDDGTFYRVFTPFFKKGCLERNGDPVEPLPAPDQINFFDNCKIKNLTIEELRLIPDINWYKTMEETWTTGEIGAQGQLNHFIENGLKGYAKGRDRPDLDNISRLSPYLKNGEISPREVWHKAKIAAAANGLEQHADKFCSELGWREFSYKLLYEFPELPYKNWQNKFDSFPWREDFQGDLKRWQKGQTGYPIVDAGMRELWQTGYMHNRVRMIVASFLIKHLMIDWRKGERWFWDTLVDADLANNSASWQWVAGSGADAAPYFRIFNPITQGEKFDPDGIYIRKYVPEIGKLENKFLNKPWEAPHNILSDAGITLGKTYPHPIVDHKQARERALEAFKSLKA